MNLYVLISTLTVGWALGANSGAICFSTAVSTKTIKYLIAIILTAIFLFLGAYFDGSAGIKKISNYAYQSGVNQFKYSVIVMISCSFSVILMTILKLPVSISQALIGAILAKSIFDHTFKFFNILMFLKAWIITPIAAAAFAFIFYKLIENYVEKNFQEFQMYDTFIRVGYYIVGCSMAYSLGANNAANVSAVFWGNLGILKMPECILISGIFMAFGILTYGKAVMLTVGEDISVVSSMAGLVCSLSASIVMYIFAKIGIPVSASQAMVGAVFGIGIVKGMKTINKKTIVNILLAWFCAPTLAGVVSYLLIVLF